MKICVLCNGYPTNKSADNVFVVKLCDEFAELGHEVTIIAPQSITNIFFRKGQKSPSIFEHKTRNGCIVQVFRPHTISFSRIAFLNRLNDPLRNYAIRGVLQKIGVQEVFYGHFWNNGYSLYRLIKSTGKPLFVATGESVVSFRTKNDSFKKYIKGVISVSSKNVEESVGNMLATKEKCIVLPNAVDSHEFYKMDKAKCRKVLGIDNNLFVIAYVGNFSNRKGAMRLASAITLCEDREIGVLFLGPSSDILPSCPGILKIGFVDHNDLVNYLNAADVYVLPTLAEGCSNSIVEAMACGLPIISSDLSFNYDILDESNSILVDPNSVEQISSAIMKIKQNDELRNRLSEASLQKANELNLSNRAKKIIQFIETNK